jgi:hypothetical protein
VEVPVTDLKHLALRFAAAALFTLSGCVAPVGPVEVTRFHAADVRALGHGAITLEPALDSDGQSIEWRSYQAAVLRQLVLAGYREATPGSTGQVAQLRLERTRFKPERPHHPVRVGVGGAAGSYGSAVGVGVGIDLTPSPGEQVETRLAVTIRDRATGAVLWEGRANFTVRATSPLADTALGAPKLAEALFKGFPGQSGETIQVP